MKTLKTLTLCVLLHAGFCGQAQQSLPFREPDYNRPKLFASLPEAIAVQPEYLLTFLSRPVGQAVAIRLGAAQVEGVITSKSDPADPSVQSVVVRSTNYGGATLTFSKVVERSGAVFYRGRIFSRQHSDAFELVSGLDGYQFVKKHQLRIISE